MLDKDLTCICRIKHRSSSRSDCHLHLLNLSSSGLLVAPSTSFNADAVETERLED